MNIDFTALFWFGLLVGLVVGAASVGLLVWVF